MLCAAVLFAGWCFVWTRWRVILIYINTYTTHTSASYRETCFKFYNNTPISTVIKTLIYILSVYIKVLNDLHTLFPHVLNSQIHTGNKQKLV